MSICWILYSLVGIFIAPALGNCPDGIAVLGHDVICPGEVGVFQCTTINSENVGWSINGSLPAIFVPSAEPGSTSPTLPNSEIYLVSRQVDGNNVGSRTSILHYTPNVTTTTNVSIACSLPFADCSSTQVVVYGRDNINMPSDVTHTVNDGVITYQWDHPTRNLVRHYLFTVDAPGLEDQLIQMNSTQLRIPHVPSTSHTYDGTVRAVGLCGDESAPFNFAGLVAIPPMEPTMESTMEPTMEPTIEPTMEARMTTDKGLTAGIVILVIALVIVIAVLGITSACLCKKSKSKNIKNPSKPDQGSMELSTEVASGKHK